MSTVNRDFISDPALSHVKVTLEKISKLGVGKFIATAEVSFDGRSSVKTKAIDLTTLTQEEQDAGLLWYNAVHTACLALVKSSDFR